LDSNFRVTESDWRLHILVALVQESFRPNGTRESKDSYSFCKSYMRDFGGYETHNIKADKT
jgi:hypothetical protein